ncbi:MAG: DUF7064 domain-containing protein [Candidatus Helarchaeota archaeon]
MINEKDEFLHEYLNNEYWRESYYYNFMAPDDNIFGVCTYGIMPEVMEAHYLISVWIKGKLKFFADHLKIEEFVLNPIADLQMEIKEPLKKILMQYTNTKRKFKLEFTFNGRTPIYKYKGWKFNEILEQEHYEQSGELKGKIQIKDSVYDFIALGQRDHSWGIRDWVRIDNWFWVSAQFKDMAINCWVVKIQDTKRIDGFIATDDQVIPLKEVHVNDQYENGQKVPVSSEIRLVSEDNMEYLLKTRRLYHLVLPQTSKKGYSEIFETISTFNINNRNEIGHGVVEYLKKF